MTMMTMTKTMMMMMIVINRPGPVALQGQARRPAPGRRMGHRSERRRASAESHHSARRYRCPLVKSIDRYLDRWSNILTGILTAGQYFDLWSNILTVGQTFSPLVKQRAG